VKEGGYGPIMIIVMGMAGAIAGGFIGRVPRLSDAKFRVLADTTASATFTCWGERLLLRMADREWYRMKRCGGEKPSPLDYSRMISGTVRFTRRLLRKQELTNPLAGSGFTRVAEKGECMPILWWIIVGLLAGWLTGKTMRGHGYGYRWDPWMDIIIGITGAIAGGLIMWSDVFFGQGGTIYTTLVATLGAVILTVFNGFVGGRRRYV
jgi:uncharacterized membrane protein YeaQ/YmgE (transglycosylase-associated protein family)